MASLDDLRNVLDGSATVWLVLDGTVTAVTAADLMALKAAELCRAAVRFTIEGAWEAARQQHREAVGRGGSP